MNCSTPSLPSINNESVEFNNASRIGLNDSNLFQSFESNALNDNSIVDADKESIEFNNASRIELNDSNLFQSFASNPLNDNSIVDADKKSILDILSNDDDVVKENNSINSNCSSSFPLVENVTINQTCENLNQMISHFNPDKSEVFPTNDSRNNSTQEFVFKNSAESELFFVDGAEEIYQNIGIETLKVIAEFPTAELRRPLMSIVAKHASRHQMKLLLNSGSEITKKEWTAARKHSRFPGTGYPVLPKPKYFRKKLNDDAVAEFLSWMHANDYIQNVAFGHKVVSYCNGVHTAIEAVKLTTNQRQIIRDFAKEWQLNDETITASNTHSDSGNGSRSESERERPGQECSMDFLDSEGQCNHTCPKTRTRCFREKGHEGRHSFTPKGRLSPSTIEKLLSSISAGKIKSLAGLDDTDATTGYENFQNMRTLVRTLSDVARFGNSNAANNLISSIDSVEQFHKIGFPRHLGQGEMLCL